MQTASRSPGNTFGISRARARKSPDSHTGPTTSAVMVSPAAFAQRNDLVMRLVERGTDQVVHGRVHDHEFRSPLLLR